MIKSDPRAREKPCIRCGYSLRRIEATHCPECGLSVWLSLNSNDSLDWSRPEWLRRMSMGLLLMAAAQIVGLAPYSMLVILQFAGAAGGKAFGNIAVWLLTGGAGMLGAIYLVAYHVGLLLLTHPERRYPDRLRGWRIGSWVVSGIAALTALGLLATSFNPDNFFLWHTPLNVLLLASGIVTLGCLRQLAKRIPNSTLARICAWIMLLPLISFLKAFPFFGLYLMFWFRWLVDFLPVIYLPASAVLFVAFANLFRRAASSSEKSWAAETAAARAPQ
jgi:hypothetical protein